MAELHIGFVERAVVVVDVKRAALADPGDGAWVPGAGDPIAWREVTGDPHADDWYRRHQIRRWR
jgi:hypothetical protein